MWRAICQKSILFILVRKRILIVSKATLSTAAHLNVYKTPKRRKNSFPSLESVVRLLYLSFKSLGTCSPEKSFPFCSPVRKATRTKYVIRVLSTFHFLLFLFKSLLMRNAFDEFSFFSLFFFFARCLLFVSYRLMCCFRRAEKLTRTNRVFQRKRSISTRRRATFKDLNRHSTASLGDRRYWFYVKHSSTFKQIRTKRCFSEAVLAVAWRWTILLYCSLSSREGRITRLIAFLAFESVMFLSQLSNLAESFPYLEWLNIQAPRTSSGSWQLNCMLFSVAATEIFEPQLHVIWATINSKTLLSQKIK